MIYLTLSMGTAVRALSLMLVVWLTAAASFPPCCWGMASAHDHHAPPQTSPAHSQSHAHHHHEAGDSAGFAATARTVSPIPAHECQAHAMDAVTTPRASLSPVALGAVHPAWEYLFVTQVSVTGGEFSSSTPPGGSSGSAFLKPLRI